MNISNADELSSATEEDAPVSVPDSVARTRAREWVKILVRAYEAGFRFFKSPKYGVGFALPDDWTDTQRLAWYEPFPLHHEMMKQRLAEIAREDRERDQRKPRETR